MKIQQHTSLFSVILTLVAGIVAFVVVSIPSKAAWIYLDEIVDLGPNVTPNAINSSGDVVGKNASGQAFLYKTSDGTTTVLPTLGGTGGEAMDINNDGSIVGYSYLGSGIRGAFKWTYTGGTENLVPGTTFEYVAEDINNNNEVVGWATNGTATRSVKWSSTGSSGFLFGNTNHKALGINDDGEMVGVRLDASGDPDLGYYWEGAGGSSNWTSGFDTFFPLAGINNNSLAGGSDLSDGAYWSPGDVVLLTGKLDPADAFSLIYGLNDLTTLVGESDDKAMLYDWAEEELYGLSSLEPFDKFGPLTSINDQGYVTGIAYQDGVAHGYTGKVHVVEPDFDGDGDVDGADFLLWQRGASPYPLSSADLDLWRANFGVPASSVAVAVSTQVPEPGNILLLLAASACRPGWRRRSP